MENKFMVPQFIDVEPKILGPVTIRQFLTMLVGITISFIIWKIFEFNNQTVGIVLIIITILIFAVFAFIKVNGQGFHYFTLNIVRTMKRARLKVWKKNIPTALPEEEKPEEKEVIARKYLPTQSRLSDISLLVDTGGAYNVDLEKENGTTKKSEEESQLEDMNI